MFCRNWCLVPRTSCQCTGGFDIANRVANHPVMRFYVRELVCYYDTASIKRRRDRRLNVLTIAAVRLTQFQVSINDLCNLEHLLRVFPGLQHIDVRSLDYDGTDDRWHGYSRKTYDRVRNDCLLLPSRRPSLEFLMLCEIPRVHHAHGSLAFLRHLKTLINSAVEPNNSPPTGVLYELKELHAALPH